MKDIEERLLKAKADLRYSYSDLEKMTGIPKSTLQRFFNGDTSKLPFDYLFPICRALQIDPLELLGWRTQDAIGQILAEAEPFPADLPMDNLVLDDEEKLLILSYREASTERRKIVRQILCDE